MTALLLLALVPVIAVGIALPFAPGYLWFRWLDRWEYARDRSAALTFVLVAIGCVLLAAPWLAIAVAGGYVPLTPWG